MKTFQPDYDKWTPPEALYEALTDETLYTRDKVELVFAFYSYDHKGQGPTEREIAAVLNISSITVHQRMVDLVALGRAERIHGKFILKRSQYSHPSVQKILDTSDY